MLLPLLIGNEIIRIGVFTVVAIMFGSMVADVLDAQELNTGTTPGRRLLGGTVVLYQGHVGARCADRRCAARLRRQLSARRRRPSRSIPPPSDMLGVIAGIGLPLLFLFPFSLIWRYRITREAHAEIRRQLDERHRTAAQRAPSIDDDAVQAISTAAGGGR